jgi:hypothetical protein
MPNTMHVSTLRSDPREWHRRGMRSPGEIDALVHARLGLSDLPAAAATDPTYADFFRTVA